MTLDLTAGASTADLPVNTSSLASYWARQKIDALLNEGFTGNRSDPALTERLRRQVLAIALPSQSLANGIGQPTYVFPATTADTTAFTNTGEIPLGTRIMLPSWFDHTTITSPALRKIANTLKVYGAFVVDRTYDTAYSIYVENGAKFSLMPNGWDSTVVADLERMRSAMRPVVWAQDWVNGDSKPLVAFEKPGVLSMRGEWQVQGGGVGPGAFDTWQQALTFPYTDKKLSQINYSTGASHVSWAKLKTGETMRFASVASRMRLMRGILFELSSSPARLRCP